MSLLTLAFVFKVDNVVGNVRQPREIKLQCDELAKKVFFIATALINLYHTISNMLISSSEIKYAWICIFFLKLTLLPAKDPWTQASLFPRRLSYQLTALVDRTVQIVLAARVRPEFFSAAPSCHSPQVEI